MPHKKGYFLDTLLDQCFESGQGKIIGVRNERK